METSSPSKPAAPARNKHKWLRTLAWAVMGLSGLLMVVYAIEDWRGRRAWNAYVEKATSAGERLEPEALIPPPVPDERNFAMAPLFQPLFEYEIQRDGLTATPVWKHPEQKEYLDNLKLYRAEAPRSLIGILRNDAQAKTALASSIFNSNPGNWRRGEQTNFQSWQAHFVKLWSVPATDAETPARDVIKALERFAPVMKELSEAAARPESRFPVRYDDGVNTVRPHLAPMVNFGSIARLRASARLATGDIDGAYQDVRLGLRLSEAMTGEPFLLSYLIRMDLQELALGPLWEGLVAHLWNEEQLRELQRLFARYDHGAEFQRAIRAERLYGMGRLDLLRAHPRELGTAFYGKVSLWENPPIYTLASLFTLIPKGWFDLNKVEIGRLYQRMLDSVEMAPPRFYPERQQAFEDELRQKPSFAQRYSHAFARLGASAIAGATVKSATAQGNADLALVALTLERHRLRHGSYPADLSLLDPAVLAEGRGIPLDPVAGSPVHYRPTEDGRFLLYYEGWNQQDDGGEVVYSYPKSPKVNFEKGDWVWPRPVEP